MIDRGLTGSVLLGDLVTPVCWRAAIEGGGIVRFAALLVTRGQRYFGDVGVKNEKRLLRRSLLAASVWSDDSSHRHIPVARLMNRLTSADSSPCINEADSLSGPG
jgi:hypothetical protein